MNERLHPWGMTPKQARGLQEKLRRDLNETWDGRTVHTVAGIAAVMHRQTARAGVALMTFPGLKLLATAEAEVKITFPHKPGLLSFIDGPAILEAWKQLTEEPDLVLVHGHGIAHPRGFGLAAHMGLWLDLPTLGVAQSRATGVFVKPCTQCGGVSNLYDETDPRRVIGAVLRTKGQTKPVFVSIGHRIDLFHAIRYALQCSAGHRLPAPIRAAHDVAAMAPHS